MSAPLPPAPKPTPDADLRPAPKQTPSDPLVSSDELFRGSRVVIINHHGHHYRLTITRNDKLLLQK